MHGLFSTIMAAMVTFCLAIALPAEAANFSKAGGTNSKSNENPQDRPGCDLAGTVFTGNYGTTPCRWSKNNKKPAFAIDYRGGNQVVNHMVDWWNNQFLPDLKNMTAELNAIVVNESRQIGAVFDAQNLNKTSRLTRQKELEQKKRLHPNETTCVAGSFSASLTNAESLTRALAYGFDNDVIARSRNAPNLPSAQGAGADQRVRWQTFCSTFLDPDANGGKNACPSSTTAGALPNGDINIEGFLLQDTIDLSKPEQLAAARAMLWNLVHPVVNEPLDPLSSKSPQGQAYLLHQEHIESVRTIAADAVASIIARRAAIPHGAASGDVKSLREKAGIDSAEISDNPSYNETMLALTKERFFDPNYYAKMANNGGAILQEQTALKAYISMQMQDIYQLQEQINALLAAKASLKLNQNPASGR